MNRGLIALFAMLVACDPTGSACDNGAYQCSSDDTILEECVDGVWTESEDCAEQGMSCHAEMGHCMTMSDEM